MSNYFILNAIICKTAVTMLDRKRTITFTVISVPLNLSDASGWKIKHSLYSLCSVCLSTNRPEGLPLILITVTELKYLSYTAE